VPLHAPPGAILDPAQILHSKLPVCLSTEALRIAGTLLYPFMPGKMQELLDWWGMRVDKGGFEHAGVNRDG